MSLFASTSRRFSLLVLGCLVLIVMPLLSREAAASPLKQQAVDLVITGVFDGPLTGGVPKGVELYVLADIPDLSIYGLGSANNGGGSDGEEFTFQNVAVTAGDYIYIASEAPGFTSFFGFPPDYTSGAVSINGDDAIELFMNGTVVDVFGDINASGVGEPWDYTDGWAYRDDCTGPDGETFVLANWSFSGPNALDDETSNATAAVPFPLGAFEPCTTAVTIALFEATPQPDGILVTWVTLEEIDTLGFTSTAPLTPPRPRPNSTRP